MALISARSGKFVFWNISARRVAQLGGWIASGLRPTALSPAVAISDWGEAYQIPMLTPDTNVDARQAYADARAVNHRRIAVWRAIVRRVVLRAIDHRRGAIIPSIPVVVMFPMIAVPIRVSRYRKSPESEHRGDYDPCRELRRPSAFRFGVDNPGYDDLL